MCKKTLADYPELLKEFHPELNCGRQPCDISHGSSFYATWKCDKADDHVWQAKVCNRTINTTTCPFCCNYKVCLSNCLAIKFPEIAAQWHPTKNGDITPFNIIAGGTKNYWWKCNAADDHEWCSSIYTRVVRDCHCPFCCRNAKKVCQSNCLANTHPELAKQMHPTLNGEITAYNIVGGSGKRVVWQCDKVVDHIWENTPIARIQGRGCPCCCNQKVVLSNCFATTHPELARQLHSTLNGDLTASNITSGYCVSAVYWQCDKEKDHVWKARISDRAYGSGCPCCSGYKIVLSNCMATRFPEMAKEWHPTLNGKLTIYDVGGGLKQHYWQCLKFKHHVWKSSISVRSKGHGCPFCNASKGEKMIAKYLHENDISFCSEYRFKNSSIPRRRFDFYIQDKNIAIEFHGRQHYMPSCFGSETKNVDQMFVRNIASDYEKQIWCQSNGITLIEVPYWEFQNISEILDISLNGGKFSYTEPPEEVLQHIDKKQEIINHLLRC